MEDKQDQKENETGLDYREQLEFTRKYMREQDEKYKKEFEAKNPRLKDQNTSENNQEQHCDKQVVTENLIAIIIYIIVMVVGTVFTERIYVYAGATMALICFLCRHKLDKRKKK